MSHPRGCPICRDNGIVIDRTDGTWDVCSCPAGEKVSRDIQQGQEDIAAGRLHRWEDVRRRIR